MLGINKVIVLLVFTCLNLVPRAESMLAGISVGNNGDILEQGIGSGCIGTSSDGCYILKLCNVAFSIGPLSTGLPGTVCGQGTFRAEASLYPPAITLYLKNLKSSVPDLSGHCACTACEKKCTNSAAIGCKSASATFENLVNGVEELTSPSLEELEALGLRGTGSFCLSKSSDDVSNCTELLICRTTASVVSVDRVRGGAVGTLCLQGKGNFTLRNNVDDPVELYFETFNIVDPLKDGSCPCTPCESSCGRQSRLCPSTNPLTVGESIEYR